MRRADGAADPLIRERHRPEVTHRAGRPGRGVAAGVVVDDVQPPRVRVDVAVELVPLRLRIHPRDAPAPAPVARLDEVRRRLAPDPVGDGRVGRARRRLGAGHRRVDERVRRIGISPWRRVGGDVDARVRPPEDVARSALERAVAAVARVHPRVRALAAAERAVADETGLVARLAVGRRIARRVAHVPVDELGGDRGLRERATPVGRGDVRDRVPLPLTLVRVELVLAPRHPDAARAADADVARLVAVNRLGELHPVRERAPAVGRAGEEDAVVRPAGGEERPADVDVPARGRVGAAIDLDHHLVVEVAEEDRARRAALDECRALVVGHRTRDPAVAGDPDRAARRPSAVERDAAVVDVAEAVPGLDGIACRAGEPEERRGPALGRGVGGIARQQAVRPGGTAVRAVVEARPGVAGSRHRAVVVGACRHLLRLHRVDRGGRLVLLPVVRRAGRDGRVRATVVADVLPVRDLDVAERGRCDGKRGESCAGEAEEPSTKHVLPLSWSRLDSRAASGRL